MRKIKSKCGYVVYETTLLEVCRLGGIGICDRCNTLPARGYLIPILNRYYCKECYERWSETAIYYPEDLWVEEKNSKYYEFVIPLTNETEAECIAKR